MDSIGRKPSFEIEPIAQPKISLWKLQLIKMVCDLEKNHLNVFYDVTGDVTHAN